MSRTTAQLPTTGHGETTLPVALAWSATAPQTLSVGRVVDPSVRLDGTFEIPRDNGTLEIPVDAIPLVLAPGGYRRSPIATRRLVREWLDAAGHVVRVEVVCEVAS